MFQPQDWKRSKNFSPTMFVRPQRWWEDTSLWHQCRTGWQIANPYIPQTGTLSQRILGRGIKRHMYKVNRKSKDRETSNSLHKDWLHNGTIIGWNSMQLCKRNDAALREWNDLWDTEFTKQGAKCLQHGTFCVKKKGSETVFCLHMQKETQKRN